MAIREVDLWRGPPSLHFDGPLIAIHKVLLEREKRKRERNKNLTLTSYGFRILTMDTKPKLTIDAVHNC